ncbi:MAG: hypothetical protein L0Y44_01925 [Phycisphaerales bacterium]|nr:hypothetical protein [Phycisphaerales bacterium]MCI0674627.1 hypothetical protein [Phycisphaerales bacterium]
MPALKKVQENAHRVMCLSNLQQIGEGFLLYGGDYAERLPYSVALHYNQAPQDLMASRLSGEPGRWDGIGLLFSESYCGLAECYYCPSHHGRHPFDRYVEDWSDPYGASAIFTNYHFAGDIEWDSTLKRSLLDGYSLVLATDGLRTAQDVNHILGMNVLRGDGSVRWREGVQSIMAQLPADEFESAPETYTTIWDDICAH